MLLRPRPAPNPRSPGLLDALFQFANRLSGYPWWAVAIEVALIWLIVWVIVRFLKGTRGARLLKGFGLVFVLAAAVVAVLGSEQGSPFARLQYLMGNFLTFAAFALIVVFQPELRRALVRLGEARLFRGQAAGADSVVEQIIQATEYLSKHKIGAIMAIERNVGLEGIIEAGTRIQGRVSAELLKTIFWPGSALHDMGVVIHGDQLVAAGVQFPLAEGDDLSQELGARHRAAIGLSVEADCLVIVVSEETGAVSLAERGQIVRKLSSEALRAMLNRGLAAHREETPTAITNHPEAPGAESHRNESEKSPSTIEQAA